MLGPDDLVCSHFTLTGCFDLVGFVGTLDEGGVRAPVSVELMSIEHQALPVAEAARHAFETTRTVVDAARVSA